ncbi:MAG: hypothetical protein JWO38_964 [Gemmataceae bacterium]|nr:hypothetical protein [Gemmataceae bacterium]
MSEKFGLEYLERLTREKADARKLSDAEERARQAEADRTTEAARETTQKTEEFLTFCKRECEGFSFPGTGHVLQVATAPGSVLLGVPPDPRGNVALRVEDHATRPSGSRSRWPFCGFIKGRIIQEPTDEWHFRA